MAATAVTQAPLSGLALSGGLGGGGGPPENGLMTYVNSLRISAVIDRLSLHVRGQLKNDADEFYNLCLSLARGIDFAIAHHEFPSRAQELPSLAKQVCQCKIDTLIQAAIMVLMISVKNACQCGWFPDKDSEELLNLAKEVANNFGSVSHLSVEPSCSLSVVSTIMTRGRFYVLEVGDHFFCIDDDDNWSRMTLQLNGGPATGTGGETNRFYPRMKMDHVFVFLEVKPGFDAYLRDFQISKKFKASPGNEIVSFGQGVKAVGGFQFSESTIHHSCERRTSVPQKPEGGTVCDLRVENCLQLPGLTPSLLTLMTVTPRLFVVQTDNIETSSCLISPAKVNFLLNGKGVERRTNLFVDGGPQMPTAVRNLLKYGSNLLQAVGEFNGVAIMSEMSNPDSNVLQDYEAHAPATVDSDAEIIEGPSRISLNCPIRRIKTPVKGHLCKHIQCFDFGNYVDINSRRPSWRCPHCNQHVCFTDIRIDQKLVLKEVEANVSDIIISSDGSWNAVMDSDTAIQKPEDKISDTGDGESPQPVDLLDLTQTNDGMDFVTTNETEDRKLSRIISQNQSMTQTISVEPHIANTDNVNQRSAHVEDDFWSGIFLSSLGQGPSNEQIGGVFVPTSNYIASPPVFTDSFTTNGQVEGFNGNNLFTASVPQREPSLPNTLQLQQYQFGNSNYTAEYGMFPSLPRNVTRTPTAVQALPAQTSTSILQERSRNTARRANLHQVSQMSSSPLHQYSGVQSSRILGRKIVHSPPSPPHQNVVLQATNQVPDAQRVLNERQLSSQQMANLMMPRAMGQHPAMSQPSYSMNPNGRRMPSVVGDQWSNVGVASPPLMTTDAYDPAQQTWRPAGRMRGALSGQAYADAYNRFMSQHNQQAAQAARPISNVHLDNVNVPAESFMPPNYPSARPASLPGGSGVFF
ncbi:hypothetical protein DH2020_028852 [Rehmannia glutinosa]|uniref:SP-RING-type domain-containing protein n=1 Tax=Rehmannia glutinosa TaxID=99300 RepID=A0ABR0VTM3_REHGL